MPDRIDRRVLGGIRWLDSATAAPIPRGLTVTSGQARLFRNRSGLHVIATAEDLEHHRGAFDRPPPPPPDPGSVPIRLQVSDPSGRYLPRTVEVGLPRNPDPTVGETPDSLFQPIAVDLYPSPNSALPGNASAIRVALSAGAGGDRSPVGGALLRVVEQGSDRLLARGISDRRGEALVVVPGIPVARFADGADGAAEGPVVTAETRARLEVVTEPGLPWPVNPDRLEANRAAWLRNEDEPTLLTLHTGRTVTVQVEIQLPG